MSDPNLSVFREMIEALRPVAERTPETDDRPLVSLWGREMDGMGRTFLKTAYRAGGLKAVAMEAEKLLANAGMTPRGLVAALEEIAEMAESDRT
jgi:hypothetical protein